MKDMRLQGWGHRRRDNLLARGNRKFSTWNS